MDVAERLNIVDAEPRMEVNDDGKESKNSNLPLPVAAAREAFSQGIACSFKFR